MYHKLAGERQDLHIAGCWSHARRRFSEAAKAAGDQKVKHSVASVALAKIAEIYHADNALAEMSPKQRLRARQKKVKPLVEAFFA